MIKLRPSTLKSVISNPYNYFKLQKDISTLKAVNNGIEREAISYLLYEQFTNNTNYQKQAQGSININDDTILEGTADIVTNDCIIDIKNSIQDDNKLINEYKYQLSAYCAIFDKSKAYLFVDTNKGCETNLNNVRMVEVPIIAKDELINTLKKVVDEIKHLDQLNFDLIAINQKPDVDSKMFLYFDNLNKIKELEKQNKKIEAELKDTVYENEQYSLHYEANRKQKRIVKVETLNEYETKWVISKK